MKFGLFRLKRRKRLLIVAVCLLLSGPLLVMPTASVIIYESIFGSRYETEAWTRFSVDEFEGLTVERSDFASDRGGVLAGYCYSKEGAAPRGVVVFSHGLGGGGHNGYMPLIDYFASNGYAVFAYDARGNDASDGRDVEGLPQGVIDLDRAIDHVLELECYRGLPILLLGHSWGAYSAGNVLGLHPEVKGVALFAGFNESEDMLLYQSESRVGALARGSMFYVTFYERLKFGKDYTAISAVESVRESDAQVLVVHSKDDVTVPAACGYDRLYESFSEDARVSFLLYEDRGHNDLFYSDAAREYRREIEAAYSDYVGGRGGKSTEDFSEFMQSSIDRAKYFELDDALMGQVLALFDSCC